MGRGVKMIAKAYGGIKFTDKHGVTKEYVYDYKNDTLVDKSEWVKRRANIKAKQAQRRKEELERKELERRIAEQMQGKLF